MRPCLPALLALLWLAPATAGADDFKVVVHPDNPAVEIQADLLSRLLLKRQPRWPDGTPAEPVEPADEALRGRFCEAIHGKRLAAIRAWWNQQIFSGREVPPLEKQGDAEVVAFVRTHRGGVGYVGPGADTTGAKVLPVRR